MQLRRTLLMLLSEKNNLVLINDVCGSLESWDEGKHAGTTGTTGSFSFYFSHHITTTARQDSSKMLAKWARVQPVSATPFIMEGVA